MQSCLHACIHTCVHVHPFIFIERRTRDVLYYKDADRSIIPLLRIPRHSAGWLRPHSSDENSELQLRPQRSRIWISNASRLPLLSGPACFLAQALPTHPHCRWLARPCCLWSRTGWPQSKGGLRALHGQSPATSPPHLFLCMQPLHATCLSDVCIDNSTEALVLERLLRDLGITGPSRGAFTQLGPDSIYQISL